MSPVWATPAALLLAALVLLLFGALSLRRRRIAGGLVQLLSSGLLFALGGLVTMAAIGFAGFRALTLEQTAATIEIERLSAQEFQVHFTFPDGTARTFILAGDEVYVDAKILKWHALASIFGFRTSYQLDRVAGRYSLLDDEQTRPRTVFQLAESPPLDLFPVLSRYPYLDRLVDARYGSGTFVPAVDGGRYEVRVSTTGLLIRPQP